MAGNTERDTMFVGFNESASRMVTAGPTGFSLFQLPPQGPFQLMRHEESLGAVSMVALMDTVPLVAVVPTATNRVLQLYDLKDKQVVSEVQFDAAIHKVMMNSKRLVVVLERHTHLFDLNTMASLAQIKTLNPPNRNGIAALTDLSETGSCYFAYPQSTTSDLRGDVIVVDAMQNHQLAPIPAHRSSIAAIAFNAAGTMIATCSDKGTVIRVFSHPASHELLYTFRRGSSTAMIHHLAFAPHGELLTATSNTGTLHVFKCAGVRQTGEIRAFKKLTTRKTKTLVAIDPLASAMIVTTCPVNGEFSGLVAQYAIDGDHIHLVKEVQLGTQ